MGRKRTKQPSLSFRGTPDGIEALAPFTVATPVSATLAVDLEEKDTEARIGALTLQTEPAGHDATWLRFGLPPSTPPGTYSGSVDLGEQRFPVTIDVHARAELAISPSFLTVSAAPGEEVAVQFVLVNDGNVPLEIGRTHAFNVLERDAIEQAIHTALRARTTEGKSRLDLFADDLSDRHGGFVRVAVSDGAGTLPPGETTSVRAALRLPDELKPGRTYTSTWPLENLNVSVEIRIEPKASERREKEVA